MALIKCKDCQKEYSKSVKKCPHCGAKNPKIISTGFGLLIIAIVIGVMVSSQPPSNNTTPIPTDPLSNAKTACKIFTKKTLHDPDSAEFEPTSSYPAEVKKDVYHVQVHLRAKNGFGALRKLVIDCKAIHSNGEWIAVGLKQLN